MKTLFVAPVGQHVGLTSVSLGLARALHPGARGRVVRRAAAREHGSEREQAADQRQAEQRRHIGSPVPGGRASANSMRDGRISHASAAVREA